MSKPYGVYVPMKYAVAKKTELLKDALKPDSDYALTLKMDGASYIWAKDLDGSVHLYGDRISKKTGEVIDKIDNMPHLKDFAERFFPNGSQLMVEILSRYNWTAGRMEAHSNSKYVNSIMLCNPEKAIMRQEQQEWCPAYVFDVLFWDNENWAEKDFADRYDKMVSIIGSFPELPKWLAYSKCYLENKAELIAEWLASGEEGGVLKLMHSTNKISAAHSLSEMGEAAKRPMHTTYKIKQVDTVDVVIMGVELPNKAYTGKDPENYPYRDEEGNPVNRLWALNMINAFKIGVYRGDELVPIGTVASGLYDDLRAEAFAFPDVYKGTVCEVTCMSIDNESHSLRHPRLMRLREDKNPKDCKWEEVFS